MKRICLYPRVFAVTGVLRFFRRLDRRFIVRMNDADSDESRLPPLQTLNDQHAMLRLLY